MNDVGGKQEVDRKKKQNSGGRENLRLCGGDGVSVCWGLWSHDKR